jgi:tight adherence protein B
VLLRRLCRDGGRVAVLGGLAGGLVGAAACLVVTGRSAPPTLPALAAAVAGAALGRMLWAEAADRRADRDASALCAGLACLADELRAGQRPAAALGAAAEAAGRPAAADAFGRAASVAVLGGDVPAALREQAAAYATAPTVRGVDMIAAAWAVSERSGAALAEVVGRLEEELRSRQQQRQNVKAQLTGPRATAALLAGLPGLGVLLAAGIGARPVAVLFGTPIGQVALLVGLSLDASGALWSLRIMQSASAGP